MFHSQLFTKKTSKSSCREDMASTSEKLPQRSSSRARYADRKLPALPVGRLGSVSSKATYVERESLKPFAYLNLDPLFPLHVSNIVSDVVKRQSSRNHFGEGFAKSMSDNLTSVIYFSCARQLYLTMTSAEKLEVDALRVVSYSTTRIPASTCAVISTIGHFDTVFGRVYVKDAPYLFTYWVWKGFRLADREIPVWPEEFSMRHLQGMARDTIENLSKVEFFVRAGKYTRKCLPLPYDRDIPRWEYVKSYAGHPHEELLLELIDLERLSFDEFRDPSKITERIRREFNLVLLYDKRSSVPDLHDRFVTFMYRWMLDCAARFEKLVRCTLPYDSTSGSSDQVGVYGPNSHYESPLQIFDEHDPDSRYGLVKLPAKRFAEYSKVVMSYRKAQEDYLCWPPPNGYT